MPTDRQGHPLALLTVHAHPDDEASKGAGTVARYAAEGVHAVLVCCTGGEQGDILNPAMDTPQVRAELPAVRRRELEAATRIIGYDEVVLLGYRDSGMPDSEANRDPRSFARADLDEAVGRLVAVIRRVRPQVVVTYPEDQQGYPHPDHIRVHEITMPAIDASADARAYPGTGDPWTVDKVYYSTWSRARIVAMHDKFLELGLESPYDDKWFERPSQDDQITTRVDISRFADVRRRALIAHATQVDPTSKFWFGLPPDVGDQVYPVDDYALARSQVATDLPEDDLFAGVRTEQSVRGR
ncbi:MAG TPA: mycothiol conjugate amidase Mca [Acidimicrobiales bacterium]